MVCNWTSVATGTWRVTSFIVPARGPGGTDENLSDADTNAGLQHPGTLTHRTVHKARRFRVQATGPSREFCDGRCVYGGSSTSASPVDPPKRRVSLHARIQAP